MVRYSSEESKEKNVTIFFSDLSGFTELAEQLEAEDLALFLQVYLTEMTEIALRFGGPLDKIIGDSIMVFFGDPESRGIENDALSCVSMALTMRAAMAKLKKRWQAERVLRTRPLCAWVLIVDCARLGTLVPSTC